jgi:hypothetical protein
MSDANDKVTEAFDRLLVAVQRMLAAVDRSRAASPPELFDALHGADGLYAAAEHLRSGWVHPPETSEDGAR